MRLILNFYFIAAAVFFSYTTLCGILNYGWRQPMFDQWRMYVTFLDLPFPQNVIQLENGHRPLIPNLFRVAEINWLAANQSLQLGVGTTCAMLTSGLMALTVLREKELPALARCIGTMLAVLGVLWLANARMLLHGNESLHAYMLTLAVVCAALFTYEAKRRDSIAWLAGASLACAYATFCFGPGAASFVEVALLGWLLRLPRRWLLLPLAVLMLCLGLYLFVLPGNQGVRGMLAINPLDNLRFAAQWISSPWISGWLGVANPEAEWIFINPATPIGAVLVNSARALVNASGGDWHTLSVIIGLTGQVLFAGLVLARCLSTAPPSRLQILAIGIGVFACATSAIIGIGRMDYFRQYPDQLYADRYLLWPSLFWAALALLLLSNLVRYNKPIRVIGLTFLLLLPVALSATQTSGAGWGSVVYRASQRAAASARSGVFDSEVFPNGPDATSEQVLRSMAAFRQRHLAMFAQRDWELVDTIWPAAFSIDNEITANAKITNTFLDSQTSAAAARVEGVVLHGIGHFGGRQLAIVDEYNRVRGLAEPSYIVSSGPLLWSVPRKRGFDGYIRQYDPAGHYRLVLLDSAQHRGWVLADLTR